MVTLILKRWVIRCPECSYVRYPRNQQHGNRLAYGHYERTGHHAVVYQEDMQ
jgi:hypothetical protein